jgi:hypothetical protein
MTATTDNQQVYELAGWDVPSWAVEHLMETEAILWRREASTEVFRYEADEQTLSPDPLSITLFRYDSTDLDVSAGVLSVNRGPALVQMGESEQIPIEQARAAAAALIELADAYDAAQVQA